MSDVHFDLVRHALALHLEVPATSLALDDRLAEDLGLDPLDVVLVTLRLEELESVELPVAALESVDTVRDLVAFVRRRASSRPPLAGRPASWPKAVGE